ncbi:hypothetical protein SMSP2_02606 [Limihaloglobus sulfuriphilus]|uniref:Uncharacterized protein n=1 Tax=Limihaloglobus sulfuriphilus TaxID=1851148 RepID=A0A1Q2MHN8_9BACT|nr:hypothetical protein SMSP2_02606 [Limihaloglobus sulfuriphilus]
MAAERVLICPRFRAASAGWDIIDMLMEILFEKKRI